MNDKDEVMAAKLALETEFAKLHEWKRNELARILTMRRDRSSQIALTNDLELRYGEKKTELRASMRAIEMRLHTIKKTEREAKTQPSEHIAVLLRVESLLREILKALCKQ